MYFPRIKQADPTDNNSIKTFAPSGAVAGIFARTDARRRVLESPRGHRRVAQRNCGSQCQPLGSGERPAESYWFKLLAHVPDHRPCCLGDSRAGGADIFSDDYKYTPVRRTALYIEESLFRGLQWVVFEPNDEPLWAPIRLSVGAFMQNLFRQGAFQGSTPKDAYFVKCDNATTTQNDIDLGIVNIVVGFAPLKPAEFVILKIQQIAGQIVT